MSLKDFERNLGRFEHLVKSIESSKGKIKKEKRKRFDFSEKKLEYYINSAKASCSTILPVKLSIILPNSSDNSTN